MRLPDDFPNFVLDRDWYEGFDPEFDDLAFLHRIGSPRLDDDKLEEPLAHTVRTACSDYDLNQRLMWVRLQTEQSFLTEPNLRPFAYDYPAGYAVPDGGSADPKYKGTVQNIRSAAWQLYHNMTDSRYHDRGEGAVGKPFECVSGGTVYPANRWTASLYSYTPHVYAQRDLLTTWETFFGDEIRTGTTNTGGGQVTTNADVARVAREVVAAHGNGQRYITIGGIGFNTQAIGWCARFVRQCHDAAIGEGEFTWPYSARNARDMERVLKANGYAVSDPQPGDVVAMNGTSNVHGHIGLVLDADTIAHNTSSTSWGPGTVATSLAEVRGIVSGYYRSMASAGVDTSLAVVIAGEIVECEPELEDGATRCDLRPLVETMGWSATYKRHPDGRERVYVNPPEEGDE